MINHISIDIETSTQDLKGNILSIAFVEYESGLNRYYQASFPNGLFIEPVCLKVNRISMDELADLNQLDLKAIDSLLSGMIKEGSVAFGRGISYFDFGFIKKDLPLTFSRFHRGLFDLNGWMRGIAWSRGIEYQELKDAALLFARKKCDAKFDSIYPHHALYDAWENVFVLDFLKVVSQSNSWPVVANG